MALSNRDRINKMFEIMSPQLDDFISMQIAAVHQAAGPKWAELVRAKDGAGPEKSYDPLDPQVQFRILTEKNICTRVKSGWYPFSDALGRSGESFASELRDVRNTWAHNGTFTDDDAYRALDTGERLLRLIGSADAAAEVRAVRLNLRRVTADKDDKRTLKAATDNPESSGLRPWREVLPPHDDVATGNFQASEFAADLYKVAIGDASQGKDYADPVEFFRRTYLTEGLRDLIGRAARRLYGDENASPVINLQTNFGGGKTHSMLSLWHLAGATGYTDYPQELQDLLRENGIVDADGPALGEARRVAIVGNHFGPSGEDRGGRRINTLWGELAWQLGGEEGYAIVADADVSATNPGGALHELLARYSPAVILVDEWVAYARQLPDELTPDSRVVGGTFDTQFTFAQSLTEAVKATPGVLLAVSIPASETGTDPNEIVEGNAEEVGGKRGLEALQRLQNVVRRVADQWRPASSDEAYDIVRQRLFTSADAAALAEIGKTAKAFVELYRKHTDDFPRESRDAAYEDRIRRTYPIHPELFDRLYEDWSSLERFQRTRGVLRLMNTVIHQLWVGEDASALILPGSIPLATAAVNSELTQYLPDSWKTIIDADVDGPNSEPVKIDREKSLFGQRHLTKRLARTVFFGAAPTIGAAQKGIERQRVFLGAAAPGDVPGNFHSALTALGDRATYFYSGQGKYWYDLHANVTRRARDQAERMHKEEVWAEIVARLGSQARSRGNFAGVHVCPEESADIPDTDEARLVILHPRLRHSKQGTSTSAYEFAHKATEQKGSSHRTFRNCVVFLSADTDRMAELDHAVRDYLAWSSVLASPDLDLTQNQHKQADERRKQADQTVDLRLLGAYQWALVPDQPDPGAPFVIDETKIDGSQPSLAERVSRRLGNDGTLNTRQAASPIRLAIGKAPRIWESGHVSVGDLWKLYASYPYMPRLRDQAVLNDGVLDQPMLWHQDGFALADDYVDGRYVGLRAGAGQLDGHVTNATLLVRPDVAEPQLAEEAEAATQSAERDGAPGAAADSTGRSTRSDIAYPTADEEQVVRRYFGSKTLDPGKYALDFKKVSDEVLAHLAATTGVRLIVRIDVEAVTDEGFDESRIRTVRENAATLKFDQSEFEQE